MSGFGSLLGGLGSGVIGGAVVRLLVDDAQFDRTLATDEAKARGATSRIGSGMSRMSVVGQAAFAALGAAALAFVASAIQAAIEHERVLNQLKVVYGENTAALEASATALQTYTQFEDEAVLAADTILGRFGLTQDQLLELNPLLADYAQATGKTLPDAGKALGKALAGNTRALKEVGIEGFVPTGNRAADLTTLMGLLEDRVGGAAEAFGTTLEGKLAIARNKFGELQEVIGMRLLPAITDLVDAGTRIIDFIGPGLELVFEVVAGKAEEFADGLESLNGWLEGILGLLPGVNAEGEGSVDWMGRAASAAIELQQGFGPLDPRNWIDGWHAFSDAGNEGADALESVAEVAAIVPTSIEGVVDGLRLASAALVEGGEAITTFAGMTRNEFREWRADVKSDLSDVSGVLGDLAEDANLTAGEILRAFRKQAVAIAEYGDNWETLNERRLPEELRQQLADMGLDGARIVETLANANDRQFNRIIGKFQDTQREAGATTTEIADIGVAVADLPTHKVINIDVVWRQVGDVVAGAIDTAADAIRGGGDSRPAGGGGGDARPAGLSDRDADKLGAAIARHMGPTAVEWRDRFADEVARANQTNRLGL